MKWNEIEINQSLFKDYLNRVDEKKNKIIFARPLPAIALRKINESIQIEWTYNSNSIEGNTLSLNETKLVIENGMTIKGKSLKEHFEAMNHQDAIEFIISLSEKKKPLKENDILDTHALILDKIEKEFSGRYRNSGVRIIGANFNPPNALKIDSLMEELIQWTNKESFDLHPIIKSSIFHHRFVWIHPFFDGNGRTARLILNLLLLKEQYPPIIILKNDRIKYYDALNKANQGDYSKLILLVIQAAERTIDIFLSNMDNNLEAYKAISEIVEEPDIHYGQEYLSLLARQGKIDAYKEGKNWHTTTRAVKDYIKLRKRNRLVA